jgi:hypothetical protein
VAVFSAFVSGFARRRASRSPIIFSGCPSITHDKNSRRRAESPGVSFILLQRPILETGKWLTQVVAGYFAYHTVPTNGPAIGAFRY